MSSITINRWDWLLGSMIVATLASLLHWLFHYLAEADKQKPVGRTWSSILHLIENPWISYPLRLVYAIGIPTVALFWQGALTARGLGLQLASATGFALSDAGTPAQSNTSGRAWGEDVNWFIVVTAATVVIMAAGSHLARRYASDRLTPHAAGGEHSLGVALLESIYHQVHWAFYREPFVFRWGIGLGSWLGALPVLLETGVSLMFWEKLNTHGAAYQRHLLVRVGLFAAGTQLYLLTQNLWLAIVLDALVGWLALRWCDGTAVSNQSVTNEAITTIR